MNAVAFPPFPPPFLVIVQVDPAAEAEDPAGWEIYPARTETEIAEIWWRHDGRGEGTEGLGVFRWDSSIEGPPGAESGAYVPYSDWTPSRP